MSNNDYVEYVAKLLNNNKEYVEYIANSLNKTLSFGTLGTQGVSGSLGTSGTKGLSGSLGTSGIQGEFGKQVVFNDSILPKLDIEFYEIIK